MDEEITRRWGNLSLSKEEHQGVTLPALKQVEIRRNGALCLVGRLIVERQVNKETFHNTMKQLWGLQNSVVFHEVGDNLYIIEF